MAARDGNGDVNGEVESLLASLSDALADQADKTVFAVGGKINVDKLSNLGSRGSEKSPIVLRWDSGEHNCRKVSLPILDDNATIKAAFAKLLADSEPATYGVGDTEGLDETYAQAGKMSSARFSTNFNPYEHGVIDVITQALLNSNNNRGVRAELHSLNIYSGPSGKFKPLVDTPRSEDQVGSLVICLPHPHQGGQLAVRHSGREVMFDWASDKGPSFVQWAAFFSDCEHEVLEVTGGHRLTLAYNLYWANSGPMSIADGFDIMDPESLHFFAALRELLESPNFLPNGGLLGFTCTHGYPHTSFASATSLRHALKGLDMLVYQALKRFTGSVRVTHALKDDKFQEEAAEEEYGSDHESLNLGEEEPPYASPATIGTCIRAPISLVDLDNDECGHPDPEGLWHPSVVIGGIYWNGQAAYFRDHVTWLNHSPGETTPQELAVDYLVDEYEPQMDVYYSSTVIVADFPKGQGTRHEE